MSQPKAKKESGGQAGSTGTRISKSASGTKATSSRYGLPTQTAGTAKPKPGHKTTTDAKASGEYMRVAKNITKMSRSEFLESLHRDVIITAKGTFQAKYKKR
jgi:hypothetical protein